jgi:hypothetical protein
MQLSDLASIGTVLGAIFGAVVPFIVYRMQKGDQERQRRRRDPSPASDRTHRTGQSPDSTAGSYDPVDDAIDQMLSAQVAAYIRKEKVTGWVHISFAAFMLLLFRAVLGQWPPLFHWLLFGGLAAWGAYRLYRVAQFEKRDRE